MEASESDSGAIVLGEEEHIVAREAEGPRGCERCQHAIDSYLNHILLSPTHHRVVDETPETFTVAALEGMRRDHEGRVRARLHHESTPVEVPVAEFHGLGLGTPMIAQQLRAAVIVVYSFGSPPVRLPNGHLLGSSFQFLESAATGAARTLMSSSEAQPDVEFWMENDALHVLQQTFDADGDRFTPLAEHVLDGTQSPVRHSISLLLKAESTSQELDEITRELRELRPGNGNHAEILLHRLRNVGVREPAKALRLLMELKNEPWYDGSTAESGSDVERDLKLIEAFDAAV